MTLMLHWSLDGVGSAGQQVDDVTAAVSALEHSVDQSRRAFDDVRAWESLRASAQTVGSRMLSEGRAALERGQAWSLAEGGITVRMHPDGPLP
ncbi:hypothetical protein [Streptomyces sp. NPDC048489]|uniref:hypothetical protein n=1 Tax=Streptomyces sp. NPDC048489 TaxID=3154504 RepID=UPI0034445180